MNIGIDGHALNDRIKAGIYIDTVDFIKSLYKNDQKNNYTIYLRNQTDAFGNSAANIKFKQLFCPSSILRGKDAFLVGWWLPFSMPLELMLHKQDVLYSPTPTLPYICPCRAVIKVHDIAFLLDDSFFSWTTRTAIHTMTSFAIKRADRIIAISESTKRDIEKHFKVNANNVSVIPRSYNSDVYRPVGKDNIQNIKKKYNIRDNYLLYVGTLEPRKNLVRLIQAYYKVKNEGQDCNLVITGAKGWLYESILSLTEELGLNKDIIFTGWVPETELPILMSGAVVLVYPSLYEGFGLPILQAMACGTPVITSNISSMPEVVGDAGILINPYNSDEIADAIRQVLVNSGLRQSLAERSLVRAGLFSIEQETRQIIEVFNNL